MKYQLKLTKKAKNDLIDIDKKIQKKIIEKLRFFMRQDNPIKYAKKLNNFQMGTYRFRIGNYRVIFDIDEAGNIILLIILKIKHRKEVYQ